MEFAQREWKESKALLMEDGLISHKRQAVGRPEFEIVRETRSGELQRRANGSGNLPLLAIWRQNTLLLIGEKQLGKKSNRDMTSNRGRVLRGSCGNSVFAMSYCFKEAVDRSRVFARRQKKRQVSKSQSQEDEERQRSILKKQTHLCRNARSR